MMGLKEFGELEQKYLKEKEKRDRYERVNRQLNDLKEARLINKEIHSIVCHLSTEQKDKVYDFLEQMFLEEIKELKEDKSE